MMKGSHRSTKLLHTRVKKRIGVDMYTYTYTQVMVCICTHIYMCRLKHVKSQSILGRTLI